MPTNIVATNLENLERKQKLVTIHYIVIRNEIYLLPTNCIFKSTMVVLDSVNASE